MGKGQGALNVPIYNGGLFVMEADAGDDSAEAVTARFLAENAIPDRYLALGLDRMARDLDDKTQALVSIDYKSLGVRQLGSIYEGLLEFKVRVADQGLAVVKEKSTYRYKPLRELTRAEREKLEKACASTVRRGPRKGDVYLENDRRERKATGSYYTPDYIVKYIVKHAVGPVLEEKLAAVRPKLRQAEMTYGANKSRVGAVKGYGLEDAAREAFEKHKALVDELFDVKPLVEKLNSEYADTNVVHDTDRQPSFAALEAAVTDLGVRLTVRLDGQGDGREPSGLREDRPGPGPLGYAQPTSKTARTVRRGLAQDGDVRRAYLGRAQQYQCSGRPVRRATRPLQAGVCLRRQCPHQCSTG